MKKTKQKFHFQVRRPGPLDARRQLPLPPRRRVRAHVQPPGRRQGRQVPADADGAHAPGGPGRRVRVHGQRRGRRRRHG